MGEDIRWKQRFENFERAFLLLRSAFEERPLEKYSVLEMEGIVQRFEYTFELAWKTLKDYLEDSGIVLLQITPKEVIKEAFAAKLIQDGQLWIDMLGERNALSHTYDFGRFQRAVQAIRSRYLQALDQAHLFLKAQALRS